MTIVGNSYCFAGLELKSIGDDLAKRILTGVPPDAHERSRLNSFLIRLETYLDITGQTLDISELGKKVWKEKWLGFIGALASERFHAEPRYPYFGVCRTVLLALGDSTTLDGWTIPSHACYAPSEQLKCRIDAFENTSLPEERVSFWQGWSVQNKKGEGINFRLHGLHNRLGADFTNQYFKACSDYVRGRAIQSLPYANSFSDYVHSYPSNIDADSFSDPDFVSDFLVQFMIWVFRTGEKQGVKVKTLFEQWTQFVHFLEEQILDRFWVEPTRTTPCPLLKRTAGVSTNIRKTKRGTEITYKLLTEVPLKLSDSEAIEILFGRIQNEADIWEKWATLGTAEVWARHSNRKKLAQTGTITKIGAVGITTGNRKRISRSNPEYLANAAATFESRGIELPSVSGRVRTNFYPKPLHKTARELGLPTPLDLLAFATLLVRKHPAITPAFLTDLELFDKNGKQTGFYPTDAGWYLKSQKLRKGAEKAEQRILLTQETKILVERLIEITQPLRDALKSANDDTWRMLFLSIKSMGAKPLAYSFKSSANLNPYLCKRMVESLKLDEVVVEDLVARFTLPRLRATSAVLIYFETQSVQRMSEALGHDKYKPRLLDRYLPKVLQQYFVERWIRIFQTGIICECMKDSPLLLRASGFEHMQDLHDFLEKHLFNRIPAHLENPNISTTTAPLSGLEPQVIFGISTEILTVLLSLQQAVEKSTEPVNGLARRWCAIAQKLFPHLALNEQFVPLVEYAKSNADSAIYAEIIHV